MKNENLFEKIAELEEKFACFFQHRKKISALENYSYTVKFHHKTYLSLIRACMDEGFLGQEESLFLEFILKRYEMNYLDWMHRTKWVKQRMGIKKRPTKQVPIQMLLDFQKTQIATAYPIALIALQNSAQAAARV